MIKHIKPRKLSILLLLYALGSLMLATGAFFGCLALGNYVVKDVIYTRDRILAYEQQVYEELCAYIRAMGISEANDNEKLRSWVSGRSDLIVYIYDYYRQGTGALSTVGSMPAGSDEDTVMYSSLSDAASIYGLLQSRYSDYWYYGPLEVRGVNDFPKVVRVMYFPMYTASRYVTAASGAFAFAAFALCLTLLVKRKTNYISALSGQLSVMAGGELNEPVQVKGNDEISLLAKNMDAMRLSFIERLAREEQMNKNASHLLTDMSHDLRTPLTALMGYLDILAEGKASSPEQAQKYIASARNRAYQIKGMTDELFEYFLVYSTEDEKLQTERLDGFTLFSQLWDEAAIHLESEGFTVENEIGEKNVEVEANVLFVRRVFDNIVSNILKYADREQPVRAVIRDRDDFCCLTVTNGVSSQPTRAESSHIGLNSCQKIANLHGGTFEYRTADSAAGAQVYTCSFCLPVLTKI